MAQTQVCSQLQEKEEPALALDVISDFEQFRAMGPEWTALVERSGADPLFLSHEWLTAWWEHFGRGKRLHVLTVRAGGDLIAAAPMMIRRGRTCGIPVRRLESIYNFHTPRYDFLIASHYDEACRAIWNGIASTDACDVVVLSQIPEESPTLGYMRTYAESSGWPAGEWRSRPSPYIALAEGYDAFFNGLKRNYRYNLRRRYEKLCTLGPVEMDVITDPAEVRDAMREGLRIEAAAWKGKAGTAMSSDPAVAEFYTAFAERAAERGWLKLSFLRVGGKRIAFDYVVRRGPAICGVKIGYDPEYHTYSPGNTLLNLILQSAAQEGVSEYDFLGVDDEWKYDWTKFVRRHTWLFLFRNSTQGRLLYQLKFKLIPKVRHVYTALAKS